MKSVKFLSFSILLIVPILFSGCKKDDGSSWFNLFSIEDDKTLGAQVKGEIESNPSEYPILAPSSNAAAYNYLYNMRDVILNSGQVSHKNDFLWELYIIDDDNTLNAFCTPGGYIYIYTGLIKYLDDASSLAGVMGHEMAHADKRHSTEQMTKQYGIQTLLDVVLGDNQGLLTDIAASLVNLSFSRSDETEADSYSVTYLCPTKYYANGAAEFFQKIIDEGAASPPAFLSTHPSPDNRVENINSLATEKGCTASINSSENVTDYSSFKALF